MYDSGITAASLVALVKAEADISVTIPGDSWYRWINEVEQTLYTEIVKEMKLCTLTDAESPIAMTDIVPASTENQAIIEDIYKIYADGKELAKTSLVGSITLKKSIWYKDGASIGYSLSGGDTSGTISIIYFVRPKLKTAAETQNLNVPVEFIELVACRLRGEAYKLANDDGQSAKWLSDYNAYVEQFKTWVNTHNAAYGE